MLKITYPREGAVLNRNQGAETAEALRITVTGTCPSPAPVLVNGVPAGRQGQAFSADVDLKSKFNTITVTAEDGGKPCSQEIRVVWDKQSFPRYNFYLDDHSFFLTDIAKARPKSLFDHFYLGGLRAIHRQLGTKFTLNLFYRNDHHPFELKDFPDSYRQEWLDNRDWLRLSFHAYSEFPDRPYTDQDPTRLMADFALLQREITRFAGAETFIQPVVVHWAVTSREGVAALARNGMRAFSTGIRGVREACEKAIAQGLNPVEAVTELDRAAISDISYFRTMDDAIYLYCYKKLYDFKIGALFFSGSGACCNMYTQAQIAANLKLAFNAPFGNETFCLASHEQYTFPYYKNYIPDHLQRIELAARLTTEHGAKPVFFAEGLLGNMAWN